MKVLAINSGSSSIKFELFDMHTCSTLASGLFERVGDTEGQQLYRLHNREGLPDEVLETAFLKNHQEGVSRIAHWLTQTGAIPTASELVGIGHRVAHGGAEFSQPTRIIEQVLATIRQLIPLAPLHNAANLRGIEVTLAEWPDTPQVAIFDTAFHHTLPAHAHQYALPTDLAQLHNIRRYGFHGTSHQYVSSEAVRLLGRPPSEVNLIVLHLGNGASATAVQGGQSIDTSMGMTPLEGLMMGTRCGDIDPGIVLYLAQALEMSLAEVNMLLNQKSGLKGICGFNDMREVLQRAHEGDPQATLAVEMYTYRIKKYVGAYSAAMPRVDAIVFTAGIGEHSTEIRERVCTDLKHLGIHLDPNKNSAAKEQGPFSIHADSSAVKIFVIPTHEELEIAKQTLHCLKQLRSKR